MSVYIQNFVKFKPFLKELVSRDVKVKYRRSILGVLWTLLNPLLMMTVLSIVFSNLFKFDIENFPLYLLCGQVIFNFFNDATTNAMSAIIGSASLIKKVYVPKYVFVMSRVCSSLINLMSSCAALFLIMIGMRAELHWTMLLSVVPLFLLVVLALAAVVFVVVLTNAERRIPVQYAKRQVGRKMYGGQASTLPMKVNMSGVLPIIFAQTIASLPATIWAFVGIPEEGTVGRSIYNAIDTKSVLYLIVYFLMIIGFSYFYATIQFNPVEISNNLKRNGGFIPGFRPGKPTSDFIAKVLNKVTLFGAIYLGIVAICPLIAGKLLGNSGLAIGGTSVIIVVGVALETVRALESQMMMRQYKGFLE